MISDLSDYAVSGHNGRPARAIGGGKTPERTGWELLAWAILEQAVDDLATYCRYGIITTKGKYLWRNGPTWWMRVQPYDPVKAERLTFNLKTRDLEEARRKRDEMIAVNEWRFSR